MPSISPSNLHSSQLITLPMQRFDAVIFDMNGTMVDDEHYHVDAWKKVCSDHFRPITDLEFQTYISGRRNDQITACTELFGVLSASDKLRIAELKEEYYREFCSISLPEVAGIRELVAELTRHGVKLACATNAPPKNRDLVLDKLNFRAHFPIVIGEEHVTRGKPDPEMFLKAAAAMNVRPERCIVFEDSNPGVEGGHAAGMWVVGLLTSKSVAQLSKANAHIKDFQQLKIAW